MRLHHRRPAMELMGNDDKSLSNIYDIWKRKISETLLKILSFDHEATRSNNLLRLWYYGVLREITHVLCSLLHG